VVCFNVLWCRRLYRRWVSERRAKLANDHVQSVSTITGYTRHVAKAVVQTWLSSAEDSASHSTQNASFWGPRRIFGRTQSSLYDRFRYVSCIPSYCTDCLQTTETCMELLATCKASGMRTSWRASRRGVPGVAAGRAWAPSDTGVACWRRRADSWRRTPDRRRPSSSHRRRSPPAPQPHAPSTTGHDCTYHTHTVDMLRYVAVADCGENDAARRTALRCMRR